MSNVPLFMRVLRAALTLAPSFVIAVACGTSDSVIQPPPPEPTCPEVVEDGGGEVPDPPDGVRACPSGACNYQAQTGCADGEACRPWIDRSSGSAAVVPTCRPAGTAQGGEPCGQWEDNCAAGYFCHDGLCRKLCCGSDWSACDEGESCIRQIDVVTRSGERLEAGVDLCYPVNNCDVFDDESCADQPGRVCRIVDPTGNVACAPDDDLEVGDPCSTASQCGFGAHCVGGRCIRLCRAEECGEPACPEDEGICVHLARDPEGVGECTLDYAPGAMIDAGARAP